MARLSTATSARWTTCGFTPACSAWRTPGRRIFHRHEGAADARPGHRGRSILYEPRNGLDPQGISELRALLKDWARRGGTVLAAGEIKFSGALHELAPDGNLEAEFFRLTAAGGAA